MSEETYDVVDAKGRIVEGYEIARNGQEVGTLVCFPDTCEDTKAALRAAGYTVQGLVPEWDDSPSEGELHRLDEECSIENHEPCDISTAVAFLRDTAEEAGVDAPDLQELLDNGYRDKEQVIEVMEAVKTRLPEGQATMEAEQAIALAKGEIDIDAEGEPE